MSRSRCRRLIRVAPGSPLFIAVAIVGACNSQSPSLAIRPSIPNLFGIGVGRRGVSTTVRSPLPNSGEAGDQRRVPSPQCLHNRGRFQRTREDASELRGGWKALSVRHLGPEAPRHQPVSGTCPIGFDSRRLHHPFTPQQPLDSPESGGFVVSDLCLSRAIRDFRPELSRRGI